MHLNSSLEELKNHLKSLSGQLAEKPLVLLESYALNGQKFHLYLSQALYKNCKKGKVWLSNDFFITLKNAKYGLDQDHQWSGGGKDGIFLIDRKFRPRNMMQTKIFDKFIDKAGSPFLEYAKLLEFEPSQVEAIRVVSHHMRLLGILSKKKNEIMIILVDFDNTK
ncbi:MAG: hypothetical protein H6581_16800 [Bacteroidia bacterium]|nr:hypothetical protein [Bacteroidia bacterium]